ncbi:hypothetical protein HPP92_025590 [Vanilla planifolia]|uniref:Beta-amylase n=1 Tax=Vanilla planifolia TaxID=51239 RepID=A0A835PIQ9_VANPL|nr:hypothetical protein HPP92_025590 [Vanilla planifolia]
MADAVMSPVEIEHLGNGMGGNEKGVPVYVMLPLDTVNRNGVMNRRKAMAASLQALKNAGVVGVMVDVGGVLWRGGNLESTIGAVTLT